MVPVAKELIRDSPLQERLVIQQCAFLGQSRRELLIDELWGPTRSVARPSKILIDGLLTRIFSCGFLGQNGGRRFWWRQFIVCFAVGLSRVSIDRERIAKTSYSHLIGQYSNTVGVMGMVKIRRQSLEERPAVSW